MIAEIRLRQSGNLTGCRASIRPRSDDRGNKCRNGDGGRVRPRASIRPRSDDRGNGYGPILFSSQILGTPVSSGSWDLIARRLASRPNCNVLFYLPSCELVPPIPHHPTASVSNSILSQVHRI